LPDSDRDLLAGIIAIGIATGLLAASITVILLSSFGAQAADLTDSSEQPHPRTPSAMITCGHFEITQVCEVGPKDIHQGGAVR